MGLEIESAADGNKLLINEQGRALVDAQTRKIGRASCRERV